MTCTQMNGLYYHHRRLAYGLRRTAFSLIEMALVLAFAGIIAGFFLSVRQSTIPGDCYAQTKVQIEGIRGAIERFEVSNDRFPAPARRNVGVDSPLYGREINVANAAELAELDSKPGNINGKAVVAVFGAIPFQTIGVPVANASDCWGNKLTYVVTKDLADPTRVAGETKFLDATTEGGMNIYTNKTVMQHTGAGYAIISHGADGLGAAKDNYTGADKKWCAAGVGTEIRWENCDVTNNALISAPHNDGKDAGNRFFDDIINYRGKPWRNKCCPYWGTC